MALVEVHVYRRMRGKGSDFLRNHEEKGEKTNGMFNIFMYTDYRQYSTQALSDMLKLLRYPLVDGACVAVEADAGHDDAVAVGVVGKGVVTALDLLQGIMCGAAHLQLHDVCGVGHIHHKVYASTRNLDLRAHIDVQHREDEIEGVFVEAL